MTRNIICSQYYSTWVAWVVWSVVHAIFTTNWRLVVCPRAVIPEGMIRSYNHHLHLILIWVSKFQVDWSNDLSSSTTHFKSVRIQWPFLLKNTAFSLWLLSSFENLVMRLKLAIGVQVHDISNEVWCKIRAWSESILGMANVTIRERFVDFPEILKFTVNVTLG